MKAQFPMHISASLPSANLSSYPNGGTHLLIVCGHNTIIPCLVSDQYPFTDVEIRVAHNTTAKHATGVYIASYVTLGE